MNEDPGPSKRTSATNVSTVVVIKRPRESAENETEFSFFSNQAEDAAKRNIMLECGLNSNDPDFLEPPPLIPFKNKNNNVTISTHPNIMFPTEIIKTEPVFSSTENDNISSWIVSENIKIKEVNEIKHEYTPKINNSTGLIESIEFINVERLSVVPSPSDPFQAFRLIFDDEMLDLIVRETNWNAQREKNRSGSKDSRFNYWTELTREELLIFLGLILHMGTIHLHKLEDYWKRHWLFNINCFGQFMSRSRFMLILRCLSFSPETNNADRLASIDPIVQHFNKRMEEICIAGKQLIIDRSMVLCNGNLMFRKAIKNKRYKGITMHTLAEIDGVVLKCHLHDSAKEEEDADTIVMNLLEEKLDLGYSVYMGSYYNSYNLARKLLDRQTYCTGILGKDRKGISEEFDAVKVEKGENNSLFLNGVHIGKWMNKQCTVYISTEFDDEMIELSNTRGETITKPSPLVHYTDVMAGISLQDKMLPYYPCEMGCTKRIHKRLFIHILQMSLSNSFYLYNKYCIFDNKMSFYDFRIAVIEKLLPDQSNLQKKVLIKDHSLTKIDNYRTRLKKDGDKRRAVREVIRKECKLCKTKFKKRIMTLYECKACEGIPGYCTECFCIVHS